MSWLRKILPSIQTSTSKFRNIPEGLWNKCSECNNYLYYAEIERNLLVCPHCAYHMPIGARKRLETFLDPQSAVELGAEVQAQDPLNFRDSKKYKDRIQEAVQKTRETEALIVMQGTVHGLGVVACAFEFEFMGGSMGSGVGERFIRGIDAAINDRKPFICFTASGGARMQEGLIALFQMAKTSAGIARLSEHRLPYITVLGHPTMGGVSASLATLGHIILAEPRALIGFAGPRVIEQTVRENLPEGFQRSEFLLEHGAIDGICDRRQQRATIARLIAKMMHWPKPKI